MTWRNFFHLLYFKATPVHVMCRLVEPGRQTSMDPCLKSWVPLADNISCSGLWFKPSLMIMPDDECFDCSIFSSAVWCSFFVSISYIRIPWISVNGCYGLPCLVLHVQATAGSIWISQDPLITSMELRCLDPDTSYTVQVRKWSQDITGITKCGNQDRNQDRLWHFGLSSWEHPGTS